MNFYRYSHLKIDISSVQYCSHFLPLLYHDSNPSGPLIHSFEQGFGDIHMCKIFALSLTCAKALYCHSHVQNLCIVIHMCKISALSYCMCKINALSYCMCKISALSFTCAKSLRCHSHVQNLCVCIHMYKIFALSFTCAKYLRCHSHVQNLCVVIHMCKNICVVTESDLAVLIINI